MAVPAAADSLPASVVTGLSRPRAVAVGPDRRLYVTVADEPAKAGTGAVLAIDNGRAVRFATGLDAPGYIAVWQNWLFVTDRECIWRIDRGGKAERFVRRTDFPEAVKRLCGICVDERGVIYLVARQDNHTSAGIYRIGLRGKVEPVTGLDRLSPHLAVSAIAMDGLSHVLTLGDRGQVNRINLADGAVAEVAAGAPGPSVADGGSEPKPGGVTWDHHGRLYRTGVGGQVDVINRPGDQPVGLNTGVKVAGGPCLGPDGATILIPDVEGGAVVAMPIGDPTKPVDTSPLPIATTVAFPHLQWTGWTGETAAGKLVPLRPIVLTHANDQSGRAFVATQHGVIHVFPNDDAAKTTKVFLDIRSRVRYDDRTNEEGFLGLAFHPDYKRSGEFFVFYTEKRGGHHNVVSRFRVSKDDPDRADPASEEVVLRIDHKYWNHDGGTVAFGPDGYLYVAVGDGGAANDPDDNGQNLNTLLGKVLRIDVNRRDGETPYAIPKDNPFAGRGDARPEVYAYGLRNVWRLAFDRPTGRLWAADVGQNLYEEIDLIEKGGNYGWSRREGLHPFGAKGFGPRPGVIEPIWEYHHDVGKSITGGAVYRGSRFPELVGAYLYADYVSGKVWALRFDEQARRVVANRPLRDPNRPIMSFGEDDRGELYMLTHDAVGRGIFRFVAAAGPEAK